MAEKFKMSNGEKVLYIITLASKKAEISIFSENMMYTVFDKLTKEFPNDFPGLYFYPLVGGFPHCGQFEDILFRAGSSGCLMRTGPMMNEFLITKKMIKAEEKIMKKHHSDEELNKLEPIVKRFIELIQKEVKNDL